jgi:hypothetical protein
VRTRSVAEHGFALLQVLVVLSLLSAWVGMALAQGFESARRAQLAHERLRVRLAHASGVARLGEPPTLALLCLAAPQAAQHWVVTDPSGVRTAARWRHVGDGVVLAELDAIGSTGGRVRTLAWLLPDSVERLPTGLHCPGSTLQPVGSGALFPRPGE